VVEPGRFDVAECDIDPVPGGQLEITMRAPDGGRYPSRGHFLIVTPGRRLRFELSHLAADEVPVFTAIHDLHLTDDGQHTQLNLAICVTAASLAASAPSPASSPAGSICSTSSPAAPSTGPRRANPKPATTPQRPLRPGALPPAPT
jgi:hypothetical protein